MQTPEIALTVTERLTLDALRHDSSVRAQRRADILLSLADGHDTRDIARELKTRPVQIYRVAAQFQEKHLNAFSKAALKRVGAEVPRSPTAEILTAEQINPAAKITMRAAARDILHHQFHKLKEVEPNVRTADDAEAVHDMRVACRRMNSALRLFKSYLPTKRVKKLRGVMEQLRDVLGAARNLDVLLEDLEKYKGKQNDSEQEQLEQVAQAWRTERAGLQQELTALLDSDAYQTWSNRMDGFLNDDDHDNSPRIAAVVPALVWKQYGAVRAYEAQFAVASLEELHALRIDIKRLRYTLEFFEDAFQENPKPLIEPMVDLQDRLGLIQDAVVAGQEVSAFIVARAQEASDTGEPIADFQAIAGYNAHLQERIAEVRAKLPERWAKIVRLGYRQMLAQAVASL